MRSRLIALALLTLTPFAVAQAPAEPAIRYGIPPQVAGYPQATPQAALASAIRAVEKRRFEYLAAHLIDPAVIDGRVTERAKLMLDAVDKELRLTRDAQIRRGDLRRERLPDDAAEFAVAVNAEARLRAFRGVRATVAEHMQENPANLRELQKFARAGVLAETGETATMTLRDEPGVQLGFRKVGGLWTLGDRKSPNPVQQPTPPPAP
jgi:hypothetical protein